MNAKYFFFVVSITLTTVINGLNHNSDDMLIGPKKATNESSFILE